MLGSLLVERANRNGEPAVLEARPRGSHGKTPSSG